MESTPRLGRPRKYGRAARAVTVTLPEDVLARLTSVHADIGSAIVSLVERSTRERKGSIRPAEVTRYGNHAVILVKPIPSLRKLPGVHLVPVGDGRALIALTPSMSIPALELHVRDAVERLPAKHPDREVMNMLAAILRRGRNAGDLTSEARTIIVLASRPSRRVN